MRKLLGCALVLLAVAAMPAQAQVSFGVGGGLLMPMGDYGDVDKMGFIGGVGVLFPIGTAPVSVRLEGTYSQTSHDGIDGNTKIIGGMASLVYLFSAGGSVTPYVLAGVGYYNGKVTVPSLNIDESDSKVGFGGGGGIRFPMGSAALFAEVRYMNISTDPSTTYLPIIVGVSFGGK
ncbi:MAG TPA: outer membrane beta-barrel protein [Gemmatimonadales bacterium]